MTFSYATRANFSIGKVHFAHIQFQKILYPTICHTLTEFKFLTTINIVAFISKDLQYFILEITYSYIKSFILSSGKVHFAQIYFQKILYPTICLTLTEFKFLISIDIIAFISKVLRYFILEITYSYIKSVALSSGKVHFAQINSQKILYPTISLNFNGIEISYFF